MEGAAASRKRKRLPVLSFRMAAGPLLQDGGGPDQAGQEVVHLHLAAAGEQGDEFPAVVGQGVGAEEFFPGYMDGGGGGDVVH